MSLHTCPEPDCGRAFLDLALLHEHADAVHTFDDIRAVVAEAVREAFTPAGAGSGPGMDRTWVWLQDIADDWCVYQIEAPNDMKLMKVSYSITDGKVTFGTPVEVTRKTVYEPVSSRSDGAAKAKKSTPSEADMMAAEKALSADQLAMYKAMRAKGMTHAMAMAAAKRSKG